MRQVSRKEKVVNKIILYGLIATTISLFYGGYRNARRYVEIEFTGTSTPQSSLHPAATTTPNSLKGQ